MVILGIMALAGELIDVSMGMMYGTLLSPILILMGYSPKLVIPSILISQAVGGVAGTYGHHKLKNTNFNGFTKDTKIALAIILPGILACAIGVFVGQIISGFYMKLYIGILVIIMGYFCVRPLYYAFSWKKMWGVGLIAGFNKALSGGGFGPVSSTGKILGGVDSKISIGTTTLAEVPICLISFILWVVIGDTISWSLALALCAGALVGGIAGPHITSKLNTRSLRWIIGMLAMVSGAWLLGNLYI